MTPQPDRADHHADLTDDELAEVDPDAFLDRIYGRTLPGPTRLPCDECPWRRGSVPGHTGPMSPQEWAQAAHGEAPIACHKTVRGDDGDWNDPGQMRQCAGAAQFRANIHKQPINPTVAVAGERDTDTVFGWHDEFIAHHDLTDRMMALPVSVLAERSRLPEHTDKARHVASILRYRSALHILWLIRAEQQQSES